MTVLLCALALIGVVATVAALVTLHLLPTGLSPVHDPVSAYGITKYRGLYRVQTIGTAVAAGALAVALPVVGLSQTVAAIISLAALAVARLLISWFPMDAPSTPRTSTGRVHNLLAFGAFAAASVSGFMVAIAFANDARFEAFSAVSSGFGWAMTIASALTLLTAAIAPLRSLMGFAERLIYVGMLAWLAWTVVVLITV